MYKGKHLAQKKRNYHKHRGRSRTRRERQLRKQRQLLAAGIVTAVCVPVMTFGWFAKPSPQPLAHVPIVTSSPMVSSPAATDLGSNEASFIRPKKRILDDSLIYDLCHTGTLLTLNDLAEWPNVRAAAEEVLTYTAPSGEVVSDVLSKIVTQEIGGLTQSQAYDSVQQEQSAVLWTIFNRADELAGAGTSDQATGEHVYVVATRKGAFAYYPGREVFPGIPELVEDVVCRWVLERYVSEAASVAATETWPDYQARIVGRTLPKSYIFFGGDGKHNHFREEYAVSAAKWDWSYVDPYSAGNTVVVND